MSPLVGVGLYFLIGAVVGMRFGLHVAREFDPHDYVLGGEVWGLGLLLWPILLFGYVGYLIIRKADHVTR